MFKTDIYKAMSKPTNLSYEAIGDCLVQSETIGELRTKLVQMETEIKQAYHAIEDMDPGEFLDD